MTDLILNTSKLFSFVYHSLLVNHWFAVMMTMLMLWSNVLRHIISRLNLW